MALKKLITATAAAAAVLASGAAWADRLQDIRNAGVLRVAAFDSNPPFGFVDPKTRQIVGLDGRLVPVTFGGPGYDSLDPALANQCYAELAGKKLQAAREQIVTLLRDPKLSATGKGAPLSAGKVAPSLNDATDLQRWTAMLSGPESMPVFGNNQLTPSEKAAIVAYIQTIKASADPGGSGIDRIGPVSEAIVIWVGGIGALMIAILWIGAKTQ